MSEQLKQIKIDLEDTLVLPDDDDEIITELDDSNQILAKNHTLLNLINKFESMENILHTHVGEDTTGDE